MIAVLESILKGLAVRVKDSGFVSKSGGLLQETTIVTSGASIVRAAAQIAPFIDGKLVDVHPDSNETVVTFFQAGPSRVIRQDMYISQIENDITLIGWINGNRIRGTENADPEMAVMSIIRKARFQVDSGSPIRSVEIDFSGDNDAIQLSRWGWDKPEFQYGAFPHRFFQQRFRISYVLATGCATQSVHVLNPSC